MTEADRPAATAPADTAPGPRFALSTVALRHLALTDALEEARDLGFRSVDLAALRGLCEHVPPEGNAADLKDVADVVASAGLNVVSVNSDPGSLTGPEPRAIIDARVDRLTDFCASLGIDRLVVPCGEKSTVADLSPLARGLNAAALRAQPKGVQIVVEAPYFGRPVSTMDRARKLLDQVDPGVGLAFDVSHVAAAAQDLDEAFASVADRVAVVHLRDAVPGDIRRPIGHGSIDFSNFFETAQGCGYTGEFVYELETTRGYYPSKAAEISDAVSRLGTLVGSAA